MNFHFAAAMSIALLPFAALVQAPANLDETIILVRHAEKPNPALGQLNCKGLNRSLALPAVLERYGRPTAIYAPSPAERVADGNGTPTFSYLRPLTTIQPYAIQLGMPVNAQIGYDDVPRLEADLLQPVYSHAYVLVAWEHVKAVLFAKQMFATFGEDSSVVPPWPNSDYDTIYVFHLTTDVTGKKHLAFRIDHEGLDGRLPDTCPTVQLLPAPVLPKVSALPPAH